MLITNFINPNICCIFASMEQRKQKLIEALKSEEQRKQKLIEALKSERQSFAERGQDTTEHDIAIQFLVLGTTSCNPDKWELLDAVMNDFDMVCSDYGC